MHTIYLGAIPEYGKKEFLSRFEDEIHKVKEQYPKVKRIGIADGALCNWEFLNKHTEDQVLDFWHATEYLTKAADAIFSKNREKSGWMKVVTN